MLTNALDYITIRGFKSIASLEKLKLHPINVLIGPNGSGKSNFVGVFSFLSAIREGRLRGYVTATGGAEKVLHFGSKTTKEIVLKLSFENGPGEYELRLFRTEDDGLFPALEQADMWHAGGVHSTSRLSPCQDGREAGISGLPHPATMRLVEYLERVAVYHLHDTSSSSPMRKTAKVNDNTMLRPDGSNLAAILYYLKERHEDSYRLIQQTVRRVAPFFDDFQLRPLRLNPEDIKLEWRHRHSDQYFDASSLSDGTLRFIALTTLLLQPEADRPSVILVDEPELGLHPYGIEMLAALIRQAAIKTQVIVSTQSSLLLDHFKPEDVLVANRVEGATQLSRLESANLSAWLKEYSLGQLWEKNEFGGRPTPG